MSEEKPNREKGRERSLKLNCNQARPYLCKISWSNPEALGKH